MEAPPPPFSGAGEKRKSRKRGKQRQAPGNHPEPLHPMAPPHPPATGTGAKSKSRRRGKRRRDQGDGSEALKKEGEQKRQRKSDVAPSSNTKTTFLDKMRNRLSGGHFRMLNEKLYTCSGNEAFNYFKNDPKLFDLYHAGYEEQMSRWPEQPVNIIVKWLKSRNSSLTVADFGCGNASLAKSVKNKVYSIDLVSSDPSVIACDMSHWLAFNSRSTQQI